MLVGTADVGGNNFENNSMIDLLAVRIFELGIVDGLNFDVVRPEKDHSAIRGHKESFSAARASAGCVAIRINPAMLGCGCSGTRSDTLSLDASGKQMDQDALNLVESHMKA
jgi:hypothetical protein